MVSNTEYLKPISSITKGPRQPNIELLRIVAMLMVVMVHVNFFAIGSPTQDYCIEKPVNSFFRIFMQCICCSCVNIFIMISGRFGIRFSLRGMTSYLFQCFYFVGTIYFFAYVLGYWSIDGNAISEIIFFKSDSSWFITAYLGLYILSPILNTFLEICNQKSLKRILIIYFCFEIYFGWLSSGAGFLLFGYSVYSFVGLYMLANYYSKYGLPIKRPLVLIIVTTCVTSLAYYMILRMGYPAISVRLFYYFSPVIILLSLCFLILFDRLNAPYNNAKTPTLKLGGGN